MSKLLKGISNMSCVSVIPGSEELSGEELDGGTPPPASRRDHYSHVFSRSKQARDNVRYIYCSYYPPLELRIIYLVLHLPFRTSVGILSPKFVKSTLTQNITVAYDINTKFVIFR